MFGGGWGVLEKLNAQVKVLLYSVQSWVRIAPFPLPIQKPFPQVKEFQGYIRDPLRIGAPRIVSRTKHTLRFNRY